MLLRCSFDGGTGLFELSTFYTDFKTYIGPSLLNWWAGTRCAHLFVFTFTLTTTF